MPNLPLGETLHEHWAESGRIGAGINGPMPMPWSEIEAYARLMMPGYARQEVAILREMSEAFVAELSEKNPLRIAPVDRAKT